MISGLDLNATVDYTLKNDTDNPTVWKLGVLPSYLFARIAEQSVSKQTETLYKILQVAIKGWTNFDTPFTTVKENLFGKEIDVIPLSILDRLPIGIVTELSMKVMEINRLTNEERKN